MSHDGELEGEDEGGPKKSERKRQREKQRRTDLSNAFDELATVLSGIEPDDTPAKKRRKKSIGEAGDGEGDAAGMTRLDLVVRTIDMLKKLQADNEDLRQGAPREKSGEQEVLVMVPTLTSVADSTQSQPPYPPYYPPMIPGQQLGSEQQSDQQSDPGQSQKHPYSQPYQQQQYHQHYHPQQHPYFFPSEREQSPPQQQEYPGNPGPYYAGVPQGHPYGNGWGDEARQYSNRPHGGGYAQYPQVKSGQSRSHDEDDERDQYAKK